MSLLIAKATTNHRPVPHRKLKVTALVSRSLYRAPGFYTDLNYIDASSMGSPQFRNPSQLGTIGILN